MPKPKARSNYTLVHNQMLAQLHGHNSATLALARELSGKEVVDDALTIIRQHVESLKAAQPITREDALKAQAPCTCIADYTKLIQAEFGDDAHLELVLMCNTKNGKTRSAFPQVWFKHRVKNAAGKPTKKFKRSYLKTTHCPMCGKPV